MGLKVEGSIGVNLWGVGGAPATFTAVQLGAKSTWNGRKWVSEIIFLNRDILGLWEVRGYSNTTVQWRDDSYSRKTGHTP